MPQGLLWVGKGSMQRNHRSAEPKHLEVKEDFGLNPTYPGCCAPFVYSGNCLFPIHLDGMKEATVTLSWRLPLSSRTDENNYRLLQRRLPKQHRTDPSKGSTHLRITEFSLVRGELARATAVPGPAFTFSSLPRASTWDSFSYKRGPYIFANRANRFPF